MGYGAFWWEVIREYEDNGDEQKLLDRAKKYVERELERSGVPVVVLMDGMDHQNIHECATLICSALNKEYGCPVELVNIETLPDALSTYTLPEKKGELNELGRSHVEHNMLITHTLSSRYDLKYENDKCQNQLEHYAAPLAVLSKISGYDLPNAYLDAAYEYLLLNHAHDSICGCSLDAVHRDMHYRFRQTSQIIDEITRNYMDHALAYIPGAAGEHTLAVFNPLPYPIEKTLEVNLDFAVDFPEREDRWIMYDQRNKFKLFDEEGAELKYTVKKVLRNFLTPVINAYREKRDRHIVVFSAKLNALGFTFFTALPHEKPVRYADSLSTGDFSAENDYISLTVNDNGTIALTDKTTGVTCDKLHYFVDNSEAGDGWFHIPLLNDKNIFSTGFPVSIEKAFDGTDACVFRITYDMLLPENLETTKFGRARSEKRVPFTIVSEITLTRTDPYVKVDTIINNTAGNHRLRLALPFDGSDEVYYVNQANAIIKRERNHADTHDWKETLIPEQSFESIVYKRNADGNGLAFFSKHGLHEINAGKKAMHVTLFRCFDHFFLSDCEKDGQLLQPLHFSYALMPLSKRHSDADMVRISDIVKAPPSSYTLQGKPQSKEHPSFVFKGTNTVFSLLRPSQFSDGQLIVRLTNMSSIADQPVLYCPFDIADAAEVNFLEEKLGTADYKENRLYAALAPYQIKTYRIKLTGRAVH